MEVVLEFFMTKMNGHQNDPTDQVAYVYFVQKDCMIDFNTILAFFFGGGGEGVMCIGGA